MSEDMRNLLINLHAAHKQKYEAEAEFSLCRTGRESKERKRKLDASTLADQEYYRLLDAVLCAGARLELERESNGKKKKKSP